MKSDIETPVEYLAGEGITIDDTTIKVDTGVVALKSDIDPNTTTLGNDVNVADGLVQLDSSAKINSSLFDISDKLVKRTVNNISDASHSVLSTKYYANTTTIDNATPTIGVDSITDNEVPIESFSNTDMLSWLLFINTNVEITTINVEGSTVPIEVIGVDGSLATIPESTTTTHVFNVHAIYREGNPSNSQLVMSYLYSV